jgi:hypothetical protein
MERSAIDRLPEATGPSNSRTPERGAEERSTKPVPHVESVTLPPFFAISPGIKQLLARMRARLGRAAHDH